MNVHGTGSTPNSGIHQSTIWSSDVVWSATSVNQLVIRARIALRSRSSIMNVGSVQRKRLRKKLGDVAVAFQSDADIEIGWRECGTWWRHTCQCSCEAPELINRVRMATVLMPCVLPSASSPEGARAHMEVSCRDVFQRSLGGNSGRGHVRVLTAHQRWQSGVQCCVSAGRLFQSYKRNIFVNHPMSLSWLWSGSS